MPPCILVLFIRLNERSLFLRWPKPIYMFVLVAFFQQERFNQFLWFLASLIKNSGTLRKCYLFSCSYKNTWDIGIYLKPHFMKNVENFKILQQIFPQHHHISLRTLIFICKFEVNGDHKTYCTECWSNLILKCYANIFVKVDAQTEKECRQTIFYLKGYSYPKLYCKKLNNQKPVVSTVGITRRTTSCWVHNEIKKLLFIKVTVYLIFSFQKKIS